jgi:predicted enzyme related to lactoylglutathione lyase
MTARFDLVTLDAEHPDRIASFWAAALDLDEVEREDGDRWIVLAERSGQRRIGVQRGAPRVGSVHLDLACDPTAFVAEVARLVGLGARVVGGPRVERYGSIVNLVDPEGTAFDLCAYTR